MNPQIVPQFQTSWKTRLVNVATAVAVLIAVWVLTHSLLGPRQATIWSLLCGFFLVIYCFLDSNTRRRRLLQLMRETD